MNLLDETKGAISRSGHSTDDVRFVGSRDGELGIPWSQAEKEYDGSEWWEYEPPFRVPETQKPFKLVKALSYYTQLLVDINYPMKATEE